MKSEMSDISQSDFDSCKDIIESYGLEVENYDNVWKTLFFEISDYSLSLYSMNNIDDDLREKTNYYLFSCSKSKGDKQGLCLTLGMNQK